MIKLLESRLSQAGYQKIGVNAPGIEIYFHVLNGICHVVFLVDYHNPAECSITIEYLGRLENSVKQFLRDRGYNDLQILFLIATYSEYIAEDLVKDKLSYWVFDTYHAAFIKPPGQTQRFGGLEELLREAADSLLMGKNTEQVLQQSGMPEYHKRKIKFKILSVNNLIVIINVMVWMYMEMNGSTTNVRYMLEHGAFYWESVKIHGEIYRFFTCIFIHFGITHLISNMIILLYLGDNLERAVGAMKYIIIYIFTGLAASVVSCLYHIIIGVDVVSGGASGAIFGVIGALVYIVTVNKGKLEDLNSYSLILFAGYELYAGMKSTGVDNAAHIGGFLAGVLLAKILYKKSEEDHYY